MPASYHVNIIVQITNQDQENTPKCVKKPDSQKETPLFHRQKTQDQLRFSGKLRV